MIDHFIGRILAGKYRIEERWREDAASQTYRATQVLLDKPVTIKVLNSALTHNVEAVRRFQAEAKILSAISDPHILNVLDFGRDEYGISFLALENAAGETLREYVRENADVPLEIAAQIAAQIAGALGKAHRSQIVHGNLSSDRILIDDQSAALNVKILDFAATTADNLDAEQTVVRADSPFYRAPEQFQAADSADARSDIYALGALVYEILTAKPPFIADSIAALANKHLNEIPPSLIAARPDLPPAMEQVVQRALAKNPNQRFQTAAEFSEALENAANSSSSASGLARYAAAGIVNSAQSPTPVETGNNPYKTAFIVLAGICLLSATGIFITGGFNSTPTQTVNADPNAQPAQPINPVSGNVENPADLTLNPLTNSNLDPYAIPPGAYPGGVPGATVPGGGAPPYPEGRIPPGLYPPGYTGGGQQIPPTTMGEANNPFTSDYYPSPVNSNVRPPGGNTNAATNARPNGNANAAVSPRPANANTGGVTTATPQPKPTAAPPTQTPPQAPPARPRNSPAPPQPATPKANSNSAAQPSNLK